MAIMFPRLARNYVKNGYFPTDLATIQTVSESLITPTHEFSRIIDPCAGEGAALAELNKALCSNDSICSYGVEFDEERAGCLREVVDYSLHSDLMDTVISPRSFSLLWLNPPYGDLVNDHSGSFTYEGKGKKRLEKLFYQRTIGYLQWGGVLIYIIPHYVLDVELVTWLTNHFENIQVCKAAVDDFKQVVIYGQRIKSNQKPKADIVRPCRERLLSIGSGDIPLISVPAKPENRYAIPCAKEPNERVVFHKVQLEPKALGNELSSIPGLWHGFDAHFKSSSFVNRPPARKLSDWHLALSLAAGAISGVVHSKSGRCFIVKGHTHKDKTQKVETLTNEDGSQQIIRSSTDRFVPVIQAWDMTEGDNYGDLVTITSTPETHVDEGVISEGQSALFPLGQVVMTSSIDSLIEDIGLNPLPFLKRHANGDWGDLCDDDSEENTLALQTGTRLFSAYNVNDELKIWIITEADRSVTTILLPSDY